MTAHTTITRSFAGRRITSLVRRLQRAHLRGWLVRIHLSDCGSAEGWPERVDPADQCFVLNNPATIQGSVGYSLDEIAELELLHLVLFHAGQRSAKLALVAPWRATAGERMEGDLLDGSIAMGDEVTVLLPDGSRRRGRIAEVRGERIALHLFPGSIDAPMAGR